MLYDSNGDFWLFSWILFLNFRTHLFVPLFWLTATLLGSCGLAVSVISFVVDCSITISKFVSTDPAATAFLLCDVFSFALFAERFAISSGELVPSWSAFARNESRVVSINQGLVLLMDLCATIILSEMDYVIIPLASISFELFDVDCCVSSSMFNLWRLESCLFSTELSVFSSVKGMQMENLTNC